MRRSAMTAVFLAALLAPAPAQGRSLSLAGNHQVVSTLDGTGIVPPTLTIECWFKFAGPAGNSHPTLMRKPESSPSYLLRLTGSNDFDLEFYLRVNGNQHSFSAFVGPTAGQWHHAAATYDGLNIRLYFDGSQVAVYPVVGAVTYVPGPLRIGDGATNENASFNGLVDEVRLWNYARSAAQIQATRFRSLTFSPGLVSAWNFNGDFSDSAGPFEGTPLGGATLSDEGAPLIEVSLEAPTAVPVGTACAWRIDSNEPGALYFFDAGLFGTSPGTVLGGALIPVNRPWIFLDFGPSLPPDWFRDFYGVVGTEPTYPVLRVPTIPALVGLNLSACVVTTTPNLAQVLSVSAPRSTLIAGPTLAATAVSPATGPDAGGTRLTVDGFGFAPGCVVLVDGVEAWSLAQTSTSIECVAPPGRVGPAIIGVKNPDGLTASVIDAYSYVPTLFVNDIIPDSAMPGTTVTLTGEAFEAGMIGDLAGAPIILTVTSPESATFIAPSGVPCDAVLTLTRSDGQSINATWNTTPQIEFGYYTQSATAGGGIFLLIGSFPDSPMVTIGGATASLLVADPGVIIGAAPPGSAGPTVLTLSSPTGCIDTTGFIYY